MDFATKVKILAAGAAAVFVLILIKKKGAAAGVGEDLGNAAVDMAGGVATGVIDAISTGIGIPTTKETITDVAQCRAYIDANGAWAGSFACGAPAYAKAIQPVEAVKETVGNWWDWLTTPSTSDYKPVNNTGAFNRQ